MKPTLVLKARELAPKARAIADALARACGHEVYVVPRAVPNPTLERHGLVKAARWHLLTHEPPRRAIADLYAGSQSEAARVASLFANLLKGPDGVAGIQIDLLDNAATPRDLAAHPRHVIAPNPSRTRAARERRRVTRRERKTARRSAGTARGFYAQGRQLARIGRRTETLAATNRMLERAANPKGRNPRVFGQEIPSQGLSSAIRPGDRVTWVDRFGKERTGRAVMPSSHGGWVLNMGGAHGTPAVVDDRNITRVTRPKVKNPAERPKTIRDAVALVLHEAKFPQLVNDVRSGKADPLAALELARKFMRNEAQRAVIDRAIRIVRAHGRAPNPKGRKGRVDEPWRHTFDEWYATRRRGPFALDLFDAAHIWEDSVTKAITSPTTSALVPQKVRSAYAKFRDPRQPLYGTTANPSRSKGARSGRKARRRAYSSRRIYRAAVRTHQRALTDEQRRGMYPKFAHYTAERARRRSANPKGRIVAYTERASMDPMTGEDGVLRQEWRVRKLAVAELEGLHRTGLLPRGSIGLDHRYIRRGVVEPWKLFDTFPSRNAALNDIPHQAVPVAADLVRSHAKRLQRDAQAKAAREKAEAEMARTAALGMARKTSNAAFDRMLASSNERHQQLAIAWNDIVAEVKKRGKKAMLELRENAKLRLLHDAVLEAQTVPAKAKAIAAFLKHGRQHLLGPRANPKGRKAARQGGQPGTSRLTRSRRAVSSRTRNSVRQVRTLSPLAKKAAARTARQLKALVPARARVLLEAWLSGATRSGHTPTKADIAAVYRVSLAQAKREASGRSGNPTRRNSAATRAAATVRRFQDRGPVAVHTKKMKRPTQLGSTAAELGKLVAVVYRSDKFDGRSKDYEHAFGKPLPSLVTDPDGRGLHVAGGKYKITSDGIIN